MLKESAESAPALTVLHDDVVEASRSPLHESIACTTAAAAAEEHSVMIHVATFGNAMDVRARVCICACANARVRIYLHTGFWLFGIHLLQRSAKLLLLGLHRLLRLRVGDEGLEWGEGSTRGGERGRDRGKRKGGTGVRRRGAMSITCSTRTHRHGPGNYVSRTTAVQVEHARMHTRVH